MERRCCKYFSPSLRYVVQKLGAGHARRFFLTGEAISASKAYELGLVHELVDHKDGLEDWAQR